LMQKLCSFVNALTSTIIFLIEKSHCPSWHWSVQNRPPLN
jgi:hypothetical protein